LYRIALKKGVASEMHIDMEQLKKNYDIFDSKNFVTNPLNAVHFCILLQLNNMSHMNIFHLFTLLKKFSKNETTKLLSSIVFFATFLYSFLF